MPNQTALSPSASANGARVVANDGRELPLEKTSVACEARAGLARVVLRQTFTNHHAEPLAVSYQVPLPADGAVSGFAFTIAGRRVLGEIEDKERARERYAEAIFQGHGAALFEQQRSSLFSQEIGNIPPGASVEAEIAIDQPLIWLAEGAWEWRFPTVVAPRYLGGPGRVDDAAALTVPVALGGTRATTNLSLRIGDTLAGEARPSSTSHAIAVTRLSGQHLVGFASEGAPLDRDIVMRWPAARPEIDVALSCSRPNAEEPAHERAFGLLTLLPPLVPLASLPRDLVLLIDASGSMHGAPLDQARRLALALVDSLEEGDTLAIIAFAMAPVHFTPEPVRATSANKNQARRWLEELGAGGGTEMKAGILAALAPLREGAQRQVVLMSDGLIGFEDEIVATIAARLPSGSRVHAVGVGAAVNRTLTRGASRAGRGIEVVLGIDDDVERPLRQIVQACAAPTVVDLEITGDAVLDQAPRLLPDLFGAAPVRIALALRPEGGAVTVVGRTADGRFSRRLEVPAIAAGSGDPVVARLFAREQVEDLETERCSGRAVDEAVRRLGLDFQIATRLTSWIAISEEPAVDPSAPTRRETMPHELPDGISAAGLGLRSGSPPMQATFLMPAAMAPRMAPPLCPSPAAPLPARASSSGYGPPAGSGSSPKGSIGRGEDGARERRAFEVAPEGRMLADGPSAPRPLSGRIILRRDDLLVVEIVLGEETLWQAGTAAQLISSDGSELRVLVDASRSTRDGAHSAGTVLRLAVTLTAPLQAEPLSLTLDSGLQVKL